MNSENGLKMGSVLSAPRWLCNGFCAKKGHNEIIVDLQIAFRFSLQNLVLVIREETKEDESI